MHAIRTIKPKLSIQKSHDTDAIASITEEIEPESIRSMKSAGLDLPNNHSMLYLLKVGALFRRCISIGSNTPLTK
jgi:hypothetical protein